MPVPFNMLRSPRKPPQFLPAERLELSTPRIRKGIYLSGKLSFFVSESQEPISTKQRGKREEGSIWGRMASGHPLACDPVVGEEKVMPSSMGTSQRQGWGPGLWSF